MKLLRFGKRVINMALLLEAVPTPDGAKVYLWMAAPSDEDSTFCTTLTGHEVEAFYIWLRDNCDVATTLTNDESSILYGPAPSPADDGDGHDFQA